MGWGVIVDHSIMILILVIAPILMPRLLFFVQVRDRVFRCDQPDMDRSLWYVYVILVTVHMSAFTLRIMQSKPLLASMQPEEQNKVSGPLERTVVHSNPLNLSE